MFHVLNAHNGMKMGEADSEAAAIALAEQLCATHLQIYTAYRLEPIHTAAPAPPEAPPAE